MGYTAANSSQLATMLLPSPTYTIFLPLTSPKASCGSRVARKNDDDDDDDVLGVSVSAHDRYVLLFYSFFLSRKRRGLHTCLYRYTNIRRDFFSGFPHPDGERISHDLARVVEVGEAVDDGNGTILGQIENILVSERTRGA